MNFLANPIYTYTYILIIDTHISYTHTHIYIYMTDTHIKVEKSEHSLAISYISLIPQRVPNNIKQTRLYGKDFNQVRKNYFTN